LIPVPGIIGVIQRNKNISVHSKIRGPYKSKGLLHIYNTHKGRFKTFQNLGNLPFELSPISPRIDIDLNGILVKRLVQFVKGDKYIVVQAFYDNIGISPPCYIDRSLMITF